jgi:hypothetical protein
MIKLRLRLRLAVGAFLFIGLFTSASLGQTGANARTFVSGQGSDFNACSVSAPCRTFTAALAQTAPGGEVVVLNSAGYGALTISGAVSVIAPKGPYGVTPGVTVSAGAADIVTLKGLTVVGPDIAGTSNGINFSSGAVLNIESCEVRSFFVGISLASPNSQTFIKDTVAKDSTAGINVFSLTVPISVSMDHITATNNTTGVAVTAGQDGTTGAVIHAAIRDSTLSGNGTGIGLQTTTGCAGTLDVERCLIANGGTGLMTFIPSGVVNATALMSISNCLITQNSMAGYDIEGLSAILSRDNNTFIGNGTDTGVLGTVPAQ